MFCTIGCSYHGIECIYWSETGVVIVRVVVLVVVVVVVGWKNVMRQGWDSNPCGQIFTPIGIAIQRFNHSATLPWCTKATKMTTLTKKYRFRKKRKKSVRSFILLHHEGRFCEGKIIAFLWYQISRSDVFCILSRMLNSLHTIHSFSLHIHSHVIGR